MYCHLFTECFHSRHLHKKPPLTQAQYVPDNKSDCGRFTGGNSGRTFYNIWRRQPGDGGGSWTRFKFAIIFVFHVTGAFFVASLANISLISLERLHATLFPYRHCLVGTGVYLATIFCSWLFSLTLSSVFSLLSFRASPASFLYVTAAYVFLCLLILTVSYSIIISTVKNNPHTPNAGTALSKERKLTVTLFTVTVVSFLTIRPWAIWNVVLQRIWSKLCPAVFFRIDDSFALLYLFNSIVNPLIYAVRMQEFRKAARKLFCTKTSELARVQPMEPLTLYVRTQAIPVEERT